MSIVERLAAKETEMSLGDATKAELKQCILDLCWPKHDSKWMLILLCNWILSKVHHINFIHDDISVVAVLNNSLSNLEDIFTTYLIVSNNI